MLKDFFKSWAHACVCLGLLSPGLSAANESSWVARFTQAVMQHPGTQTAQAELESDLSRAKVFGARLYNPELDAELESEGSDTNFRVGVSQTLDWWNRQDVVSTQSERVEAAAQSRYRQQLLQRFAEGMQVLIDIDAARRDLEFARNQERQQRQILELIEQRQQAGDLGQVDAELAHLGLIQKMTERTQADTALIRAEAQLAKVLPGFSGPFEIPEAVWSEADRLAASGKQPTEWAKEHPEVQQAITEWQSKKTEAKLVSLEAKAEPRLGIGAGRSGEDNVFALTLSLPLHVRNDFSSNIEAANQAVTSTQVAYQATTRNRIAEIEASQSILRQYAERYAQWQEMILGRKTSNEKLLERLWSTGELSTTEYLNIRQQGSEAVASGIELKTGLNQARIDWLVQSGRILTLFLPSPKE